MPEESQTSPITAGSELPLPAPIAAIEHEEEQTDNPVADKGIEVTLSVPETIDVRMVNASTLEDYEVWFFLSSIAGSALSGFFVATLQASDESRNAWIAVTVFVLIAFIVFVWQTFAKRNRLRKSSKTRAIPYIQAPKKRKYNSKRRSSKRKKEIENEPQNAIEIAPDAVPPAT